MSLFSVFWQESRSASSIVLSDLRVCSSNRRRPAHVEARGVTWRRFSHALISAGGSACCTPSGGEMLPQEPSTSAASLQPAFSFSCSRGGRATVRHALGVRDPGRPHFPEPTPQQVRHPGTPPEALEMEEEEDGEVQTDLSWYVPSSDSVPVRGDSRRALV